MGAVALALTPWSRGQLMVTVALFMVAMTGLKAYLPAFWSLPSLFLAEAAAAHARAESRAAFGRVILLP